MEANVSLLCISTFVLEFYRYSMLESYIYLAVCRIEFYLKIIRYFRVVFKDQKFSYSYRTAIWSAHALQLNSISCFEGLYLVQFDFDEYQYCYTLILRVNDKVLSLIWRFRNCRKNTFSWSKALSKKIHKRIGHQEGSM